MCAVMLVQRFEPLGSRYRNVHYRYHYCVLFKLLICWVGTIGISIIIIIFVCFLSWEFSSDRFNFCVYKINIRRLVFLFGI